MKENFTLKDLYNNSETYNEHREILRRLPNGEITIK